ncbi:hypothetical protein WOLCODRAFT_138272 [Wolfiporia cocos MD-104 SS10]|uniref:F-box domain-containing protein n=1 Tax=Wolfiporia cocos (strain MD-104) TaxID=742152 RepID=A0A2H3JZG4_WOLCO|nr:hypothetical protein WOLCODRAFT_138272 [Wolfiporia cocos MD-104 SS10]
MGSSNPPSLSKINDDTLILVLSCMPVRSVLAIRQTCKRMLALSRTRIIWHNAYVREVLPNGFPFPCRALLTMPTAELERAVCRSMRIGKFWRSSASPRRLVDFQASHGSAVNDVRFLPGYEGNRVVTVAKGIWSVIAVWELPPCAECACVRKLAEWAPRGAIFAGFAVNSDPSSDGLVATSVNAEGRQRIEILSLVRENDIESLRPIKTINSTWKPIALKGDFIAYSDDCLKTIVMNWRTGATALLRGSDELIDQHFNYNRCLQIVFTYKSVLVVRARSIELFAEPVLSSPRAPQRTLNPLARHSFGWIDGVSINVQVRARAAGEPAPPAEPLAILLRSESDDPWTSDVRTLDLYVLEPNPLFGGAPAPPEGAASGESPYAFPPVRSPLSSPSERGFLRCTAIILGPYGTAVWIQPRPARFIDLTALDVHSSETQAPEAARAKETLAAAMFCGLLWERNPGTGGGPRGLWTQSLGSSYWNAIDYCEELGRIALASSQGMVTILELG